MDAEQPAPAVLPGFGSFFNVDVPLLRQGRVDVYSMYALMQFRTSTHPGGTGSSQHSLQHSGSDPREDGRQLTGE